MAKDVFILFRPQWKTHIGFLLAAIGFSFVWENIWDFNHIYYKNSSGALFTDDCISMIICD